jgi:cytochrome c oxidase subunit I
MESNLPHENDLIALEKEEADEIVVDESKAH